ncbi:hypothetical protein KY290_036989 [Solanum tuberosum]|uniref:Uncharacterized protein n=1 Tax=Solanum tuberosum TaxID=4113 RepID=A0ABQ7TVK9_SOLTU|nr:hypothetical protein KY290_036989 [Solanum tuberosum]
MSSGVNWGWALSLLAALLYLLPLILRFRRILEEWTAFHGGCCWIESYWRYHHPPGSFFLARLGTYRWLGRLGDIGDRPRASLSSWAGSVLLAGCPRVALSSWAGSMTAW